MRSLKTATYLCLITFFLIWSGFPVRSQTFQQYYIEISISKCRLTLYSIGPDSSKSELKDYKIATATRGLRTVPLGIGHVTRIQLKPYWYPTELTKKVFLKRGIELPDVIPPGHRLNYMGSVKISLSHRTAHGAVYRIHGTNNERTIGKRVTSGCIRLKNKDAEELARMISVGTVVNIQR